MYQRILIATDGSELSMKSVEQGLVLASQLKAQVAVVTVSEPIVTGFDDALGWGAANRFSTDYQKARDEAAQRIFEGVTQRAQAHGLTVAPVHIRDRYAAEGIIEAAAEQKADLIVMASHGRRGLGRLLIGSQTHEVLTHSHVPVLVVR